MGAFRRGLPLLFVALAAACGTGGHEPAAPVSVSGEELAAMVLPREALGASVAGFRVDKDSGPSGNMEAAEDTLDPEDTGRSLGEKGRVTGYDLAFTNPKLASFDRKKGVYGIETSVELFRDEVYASEYLGKQVADFERFDGTRVDGIAVSGVSSFPLDAVGDEASGFRATARFAGVRIRQTTAAFRRGRIVAAVSVVRADRENVAEEARRLAHLLDARIEGVLNGEIESGAAERAPKPKRLDPARLTLTQADLPAGASVAGQGYRRHGDVRSYLREFEPAGSRLGSSQVIYLRAMAQVLEDEGAATLFMRIAERREGREQLARTFFQRALSGINAGIRGLRIQGLPAPSSGTAFAATIEAPKGTLTAVMLFVRSGRAVGSVTALGVNGELRAADVLALAGKVRARLGAGR